MPNFEAEGDEAEFLAGIEDFQDIPEQGATHILEMGSGQAPSMMKSAGRTGIPLGGSGNIDPNSVSTPRRKVAARQKPWVSRGDYSSIYSRSRGSAMAALDFSQTPSPKNMSEPIKRQGGPIDQRVHEINEGPTGQGFVGKVKTPRNLAAKDEEEPLEMKPKEIGSRSPNAFGEGSEVQASWSDKMAKLQVLTQKQGAVLMSFAEFRLAGGSSPDEYTKYLQSRCYACAEQVENGVMCHECYAVAHSLLPKKKEGSAKEIVIDILKTADSKSMIVPPGKSKTKKFDWDTNRSAEKTDGWGSVAETGEKEYKLHDAEHYKEQTGAILEDPLVKAREKVTLTRGDEQKKPDEATQKRYAAKKDADAKAAIDKEIKVDIAPADKKKLLERKSLVQRPEQFPPGRKSQTDERLIDYDGSKAQDYVTEFNFKGAERVKKDYPYQLMKAGPEGSIDGLPKSSNTELPTRTPSGVPVPRNSSGVPIHASGSGRTLGDDLGTPEREPSPFSIGEKVVSAAFEGIAEVADLVYGDSGQVVGAVVENSEGLGTIAVGLLKKVSTDLTDQAKTDMQAMGLDPMNPEHVKNYLEKTKTARYQVQAKPNIMAQLHGRIGYRFEHNGRTALLIPKMGKFYFRDEDIKKV